ncbi:hypothetical protein GUJ93_ZPchr0004g39660 [Zizania palustris]|uniref:Sodium/calcium exchanger membrane region domain-containing protein n=1 Tax=Zizania palustris TaxID=103762 RepID=A0A8J5SXI3_ZIZPA|nr:hypothetical protein GUJ93_ZPchr0004g39660 [Zizania palustris]
MTTNSSGSWKLLPGRLQMNSHHLATSLPGGDDELEEEEVLVSPEELQEKTGGFQRIAGSVIWENSGSLKIVFLKSKLNVLIPCGFLAILVNYVTHRHGWVFSLSLLGIVPLAERLGFATEQLALFTSPTVGGILNATFGNATELVISIHALRSGKLRVVQQSLLGSILSNLLLVLGCAFFSGGLSCGKTMQTFSKADAVVNSGLLLMAVMGLLIPAALYYTYSEVHFGKSELALSRFSSCIMLAAYASYIYFQLSNSRQRDQASVRGSRDDGGGGDDEEGGDKEVPEISQWEAITWLAVFTAWISLVSAYLVDAIDVATNSSSSFNLCVIFFLAVYDMICCRGPPKLGTHQLHSSVLFCSQLWGMLQSLLVLSCLQ